MAPRHRTDLGAAGSGRAATSDASHGAREPRDPVLIKTSSGAAEPTEPIANPLDELAWMVGDWVDHDGDATVETSVAWTKNRKFLRRMFRVTPTEGEPHSGMQVIGWDPAEKDDPLLDL